MKKLIAAMAAIAMLAAISTTAFAESIPITTGTEGATGSAIASVTTTTIQEDTYSATIDWGTMAFAYDFGTWNVSTHQWDNEKWVTDNFNGSNDKVTVTNNSSQPIDATFDYLASGRGINNGDATTGVFTTASGAGNPTLGTVTDTMGLALCQVDALTGPSDDTFLNLVGRPAASIGKTAAVIGTITVTLTDPITTGATTELAKVTDTAVTTVPAGTDPNDKPTIEAAMLVLANAAVADGYTVTIASGSTYDIGTNAWTGRFTVTNDTNETDTRTDAADRAITVVIATA